MEGSGNQEPKDYKVSARLDLHSKNSLDYCRTQYNGKGKDSAVVRDALVMYEAFLREKAKGKKIVAIDMEAVKERDILIVTEI